ncbi:MAG: hypothetical protein K9G62_08675 [Alphaproteobacteria bacterium]|nr:hypothetical protein [Alphaproteobacteria bacterium]
MIKTLSNRNLAILTSRLQIPVIVSDILDGREMLDGDMHYTLHEVISDMAPDSALLTIALCARTIAGRFAQGCASMKILELESDRIVDEYGGLWLLNANDESLDDQTVMDALDHAAEDLASLGELLDLNESYLRPVDVDAAALCEILFVQAKSHALIAEVFLEAAEGEPEEEDLSESLMILSSLPDNVIPFPQKGARRA